MSAVPVPKPRALAAQNEKRPVPLPRTIVPKNEIKELSPLSKQKSEDSLNGPEKVKTIIENVARESLRRIKRKSRSNSQTEHSEHETVNIIEDKKLEYNDSIFGTIRFKSPLTVEQENREYDNLKPITSKDNNDEKEEEPRELPPPNYPPPAPPDLAQTYDMPSLKSPPVPPRIYESIFPPFSIIPHESDSDQSGHDSLSIISGEGTDRSSWVMYDPVTLNDSTYSNVEIVNGNRSSDSESIQLDLSSVYENHILELRKKNEGPPPVAARRNLSPPVPERPSKSTILEFDPLVSTSSSENSDMLMLEELLSNSMYGSLPNIVSNYDQVSLSGSEPDDYLNPPTPPKRSDSLVEESKVDVKSVSQSTFFTDASTSLGTINETKKQDKSWLTRAQNVFKKSLLKEKFLDRPSLNSKAVYQHTGLAFRISSKTVEDLFGECHVRWIVLSNGVMIMYADSECSSTKESIPLDTILSVQIVSEKISRLDVDMHCFEINTSGSGRGRYIYGVRTIQERKHWMQKIAEALTNRFPSNITMDYVRVGWAYIRESISGTWTGAWILLRNRHLYHARDDILMGIVDLRKARFVQLQEPYNDSPRTTDNKGPNLVIDCQEGTLYLRMWTGIETKCWCIITQQQACCNGRSLENQQLTKDNVPVIVEKCINYLFTLGSMSEGIYRKSGSSTVITEVLNNFRKNAWTVGLTGSRCNEHDVANVLKRFFRDLPEPLINEERSHYMCQIANAFAENSEKITMYRAVLEQFSPVSYATLKKLLGHLHFIQSQVHKNKMTVMNLAAIWGPTIIYHEGSDLEMSSTLSKLVVQLIELYRDLFPISAEELNKEKLMIQVLERCYNRPQGPQHIRASGDLRVWVHLGDKNGEAINITIGPQKLAADICIELSTKMNLPPYELQLEELVLNDKLRRPIHYSERALEVVLRWAYWNEKDRKDNCLVLTAMSKYKQFDKASGSMIVSEQLKFADNKTKRFQNVLFKFEQAKLCYYKEIKNMQVKVQEWNIEDILWYFGYEHDHNPQTKWALTFILRTQPPKRTKSIIYFGYTIGGNDMSTRTKWINLMIRAEHSNGLAPPLMNIPNVE